MMAQNDAVLGEPLTPREAVVCARLKQGWSAKQVAIELGISVRTVDMHSGRIYQKLQVSGKLELIAGRQQ